MKRFNRWLANTSTNAVGTMACVYLFSAIGLTGVIAAITNQPTVVLIVGAISGYFLQLVLLPLLMVGQKQQAEKTDAIVESHAHTHRLILALHRHHGIPPESE